MAQTAPNKPYFKGIYNSLYDKFNYIEYVGNVKSNKDFIQIFNVLLSTLEIKFINKEYLIGNMLDILHLLFITETYLGFLFETVILHLFTTNGFKPTYSEFLDNIQKVDILLYDDIKLQLKNISFLYGPEMENRLKKYNNLDELRFLFYKISSENIFEICSINGTIFPLGNTLDGFSATTTNIVGINDFIHKVKLKDY
jgi:hypothetical protein